MKTISLLIRLSFIVALAFSTIAAAPASRPVSATQNLLADLGGFECFEGSAFTCVEIEVPLDHFNPADTRTLLVTFAVLPASGPAPRKGMFVTATGGPGYSGVASADFYLPGFDPSIQEVFDIVFFDQRGLTLSGDQNCPFAGSAYYQQDARGKTPSQEAALKQAASTFVTTCYNEVSDPSLLPYLGTEQAVEDLEYFRQLIGDELFWLYGESYGTQYSQTYAAKYSDHLAGLILDGTVDLTLDGNTYYTQQAQAFSDTLTASLSVCNDDPVCRKDMLGNAVKAYDRLADILGKKPIHFKFPLPQGGFATRTFTFTNLEFVAASQMYSEGDRMMFTRALASFTSKLDIIPLARLLYLTMGLDPQTLDLVPDPFYSEAVYYGVECQDYGYPGSSSEEKANLYLAAVDSFEFSIPRLASLIYGDLPCTYWPDATTDLTRPDYLLAEGVPTLVLGSTADPATPYGNGVNVYQNLADGYLISQEGGPHVIFGRGNVCPDALVTDFLVNDVVPAQRETVCEGYVVDEHIPLAPRFAATFGDPRSALSSVETEIYYLPEFYYWGGEPTSTGCTYGGVLGFSANNAGTKYNFTLNKCQLTQNFIMTGTGSYNTNNDRFVLDVSITGRWKCNLKYTRTGDRVKITGKCNGKTFNVDQQDSEYNQHKMPELNEQKDNR